MIARQPGQETALDRVAGALSSEAARTELYRYANGLGEQLPPDSSTWYVVGAVIQVNSVTRHELTTLAAEAKRGGTILSGFFQVAQQLPKMTSVALAAAGVAVVCLLAAAVPFWNSAYGVGWGAQESVRFKAWNQSVCESLANVRHELRTQRADIRALDRERTRRGC